MIEMKLINLTPHPVVVLDDGGKKILEIPPSGKVARVEVKREPVGTLAGVPLVRSEFGEPMVGDLPFDKALHVCDNCKHSDDLSCPVWPREVDEDGVWSEGDGFIGMCACDEQVPKVIYIVSTIVLQAINSYYGKRNDVVAPDTSPAGAVRDSEGRIIGVKAFVVR